MEDDDLGPKLLNLSDGTATPSSPKDRGNIIYWVYVLYGFSVLSIFNSILSTLDFFINSMPSYNP
jgi:hypothetical protein